MLHGDALNLRNVLVIAKTSRLEVQGFLAASSAGRQSATAASKARAHSRMRDMVHSFVVHTRAVRALAQVLREAGATVRVIRDVEARSFLSRPAVDGVDTVFTAGGDGTFLRTAAYLSGSRVPILGVNTDPLRSTGELCSIVIDAGLPPEWDVADVEAVHSKEDLAEQLDRPHRPGSLGRLRETMARLRGGAFTWFPRRRVRSSVVDTYGNAFTVPHYALNEVFISEQDASRPSVLELSVADSGSAIPLPELQEMQRRSATASQLRYEQHLRHPERSPASWGGPLAEPAAGQPEAQPPRYIHPADLAAEALRASPGGGAEAVRASPGARTGDGEVEVGGGVRGAEGAPAGGAEMGVAALHTRGGSDPFVDHAVAMSRLRHGAAPAVVATAGAASASASASASGKTMAASWLDHQAHYTAPVREEVDFGQTAPAAGGPQWPPGCGVRSRSLLAAFSSEPEDHARREGMQRATDADLRARTVAGLLGPRLLRSSGLLLSTGTGSTAWMQSAMAVTDAHVERVLRAAGLELGDQGPGSVSDMTSMLNGTIRYRPDAQLIHHLVREPLFRDWSKLRDVELLSPGFAAQVTVRCHGWDVRMSVDGVVSYELEHGWMATFDMPDEGVLWSVSLPEEEGEEEQQRRRQQRRQRPPAATHEPQ